MKPIHKYKPPIVILCNFFCVKINFHSTTIHKLSFKYYKAYANPQVTEC